ncbi:hypothetical protein [Candidatus Protofrankia californiensis]|uniref:hypothetical protein n=1 Tax=Candidatus Protofrankia californiensis TaxID=1839754 RepID=UPI001041903A|nr:hypothetical protein [Candidatus Protofrankia californiensis]
MTESTVPDPESGAAAEPGPAPDPALVDVDLDLDAALEQAPGGLSVGELLDTLDLQPLTRTMQDAVAAVTADVRGSLSASLYEVGLGKTFPATRLLGDSWIADLQKATAKPLIDASPLLAKSFSPAQMFGDALRLNDQLRGSLSKSLYEAAGLGKTFSAARLLGNTFDSIKMAMPMLDAGALLAQSFTFNINTILGSLGDLWTSTLFDQVHTWLADFDSGPGLARAWARRALGAVRRARRAALAGRLREVERFIEIYLDDEVEAYLARLGQFERGAVAGHDYRRAEAVTAVVLALLCLPPLPDDEEADGLVVLDELGGLVRGQLAGFQPTWRHVRGGRAVQTFDELPASSADTLVDVDLTPGEYADDRLGHVARMLKPDELVVIETYADNLGSLTWPGAAAAAGYPDRFGEHVRRKRKTLAGELERRAVAQAHTEDRFGRPWR